MRRWFPMAAAALSLLAVACGGKDEEAAKKPEDEIAVRVDDWTVSKEFIEAFLKQLPESQRRKYDSPQGRAELAAKAMQDELFYREALRENLSGRESVKKQVEEAKRAILIQEYYKEFVDAKARPTEEEIHDYYEANQDRYTTLAACRAQHIFSKSNKKLLLDIKKRVEEGGEKFTTMAHQYSEDKLTQQEGGDLGWFNPGGYIPGVGYSKEFSDTVFTMQRGKIYGPITWEQGYSLIRVNEMKPAALRPYEEVKQEISDRLTREKVESVRAKVVAELAKRYDTHNYLEEAYNSVERGPEELFNFAQNSENPQTRIKAFEEIVERFPNDEYASQALFMVGFVYAEELQDVVMADKTFNEVIRKYPDSEIAKTAKWMLDNLDKPIPEFENLDELNRKIEEGSN